MTDMLDLITLFAGIGIGWLMGRTAAKPHGNRHTPTCGCAGREADR